MKLECAQISLLGQREENQDRVAIVQDDRATLLIVVDGMGGHSDGAMAAETAVESISESFLNVSHPVFDPHGFLHTVTGRAHDKLVSLGNSKVVDARPRATCALCLIQDGGAYWAHVGDSRIYLVRGGRVVRRTRDHSHVELLLREGLITEEEVQHHPMRNFVECCLGGDASMPEMSVSRRVALQPGDVILACSDGLWSGVSDEQVEALGEAAKGPLSSRLEDLAAAAVDANAPYSDNTTGAAVRLGE